MCFGLKRRKEVGFRFALACDQTRPLCVEPPVKKCHWSEPVLGNLSQMKQKLQLFQKSTRGLNTSSRKIFNTLKVIDIVGMKGFFQLSVLMYFNTLEKCSGLTFITAELNSSE